MPLRLACWNMINNQEDIQSFPCMTEIEICVHDSNDHGIKLIFLTRAQHNAQVWEVKHQSAQAAVKQRGCTSLGTNSVWACRAGVAITSNQRECLHTPCHHTAQQVKQWNINTLQSIVYKYLQFSTYTHTLYSWTGSFHSKTNFLVCVLYKSTPLRRWLLLATVDWATHVLIKTTILAIWN